MRVAEFYLVNEKGEGFSLMDEKDYCLLTAVERAGLWIFYSIRTTWKYLCSCFKKARTRNN